MQLLDYPATSRSFCQILTMASVSSSQYLSSCSRVIASSSALMLAIGLVLDTEVKSSRRSWELACGDAFREDARLRADSRRRNIRADMEDAAGS